jgi:uncharacterized protein (UPF0305 family)
MNPRMKRNHFVEAMESALAECREQIRRAVRQYENEIDSHLRDLRRDLTDSKSTVH